MNWRGSKEQTIKRGQTIIFFYEYASKQQPFKEGKTTHHISSCWLVYGIFIYFLV